MLHQKFKIKSTLVAVVSINVWEFLSIRTFDVGIWNKSFVFFDGVFKGVLLTNVCFFKVHNQKQMLFYLLALHLVPLIGVLFIYDIYLFDDIYEVEIVTFKHYFFLQFQGNF